MIRDQNFGYQKGNPKKKYIACCFVCGCSSEKVFTQINQYFFQDTFFDIIFLGLLLSLVYTRS